MVALIVAEEVVSWAAELVAAEAVVMLVAAEADLEVELSHDTVVLQALPLSAGVDHPWVDGFLNNCTSDGCEYNRSVRQKSQRRPLLHSKDKSI